MDQKELYNQKKNKKIISSLSKAHIKYRLR